VLAITALASSAAAGALYLNQRRIPVLQET